MADLEGIQVGEFGKTIWLAKPFGSTARTEASFRIYLGMILGQEKWW
jgi:hypothetical protein